MIDVVKMTAAQGGSRRKDGKTTEGLARVTKMTVGREKHEECERKQNGVWKKQEEAGQVPGVTIATIHHQDEAGMEGESTTQKNCGGAIVSCRRPLRSFWKQLRAKSRR